MRSVILDAVCQNYGSLQVLHDISLSIEAGEFIVLLGASGCGKSTLLSAIAGLDPITSGRIIFDGQDVSQLDPADRGIGMVFQSYALYPNMTVRKNISFALEVSKLSKQEVNRRVAEVSQTLQIANLLDRKPSQLSGGQRQRVAIGRALARRASLFLFDEPLSNLDAKLRTEMRTELKRLHSTLGATFIYVTHDQVEAMTLATRIAVLKDGRIEQFGTPDEIYHRPASTFVASFIGTPPMNLFPLSAEEDEDVFFIRAPASLQISSKTAYVLGIRPEDLTLNPTKDKICEAQVSLIEGIGADRVLWFVVNENRYACRLDEECSIAAGEIVSIYLKNNKFSIFDVDDRCMISVFENNI